MDLPITLLVNYIVFTIFTFYQKLHTRNFQGTSQVILLILNICFLLSTAFRFGLVLYYGYEVSWIDAIILFITASIFRFIWFTLELKLGIYNSYFANILSLSGLIILPVCANFIWKAIP